MEKSGLILSVNMANLTELVRMVSHLLLDFLELIQQRCSAVSCNINPGLSHRSAIQCGLDFKEIESCLKLLITWIQSP